MLNKLLKETALFIFDIGLILYFLIYCCFDFFINLFIGTKIAILLSLILKNIDRLIEEIGVLIIKKLEKKDMWY